MKITGWIMLIFGILGFIGSLIGDNKVIGPCFWIALGAFLLYRANNR